MAFLVPFVQLQSPPSFQHGLSSFLSITNQTIFFTRIVFAIQFFFFLSFFGSEFLVYSKLYMYIEKMEKKSFMCIGWKLCHYPLSGMIYIACIEFYQIMSSGYCHFQQYFSYFVAVSFIGGVPGENHWPVASPQASTLTYFSTSDN